MDDQSCKRAATAVEELPRLFDTHGTVDELWFDDELQAHLEERGVYAKHRVSLTEILEVHSNRPRFFANTGPHRAPVVMLGPTRGGRFLCVPIEPVGDRGQWHPVTAFEANAHHVSKYMESNNE